MKITPWYLAALAPFAAIASSGAYLGHAAVVILTIGIFLGTLSLGRAASSPPPSPLPSADGSPWAPGPRRLPVLPPGPSFFLLHPGAARPAARERTWSGRPPLIPWAP